MGDIIIAYSNSALSVYSNEELRVVTNSNEDQVGNWANLGFFIHKTGANGVWSGAY